MHPRILRSFSVPGIAQTASPNGHLLLTTWRWAAFALLCLLFWTTSNASAQVANGSIAGRVTDPTGAILPGTDVTLTRTDTGLVLHATTNGDGVYTFPSLQTGPYTIDIAKSGFKETKASVVLSVDQNARLDLSLPVGSKGETVTIEATNGTQLDTENSSLDFTVGKTQVSDLPLNGRNPYGLAALSPGIIPGNSFGAGVSTARGAVVAAATNNFQSNGGIGGSNEILLDGVSIVVCCQGQPPLTPSVEVVDQFKVITSVPPAQFGRSSGGILNIVTKTGTNGLHGDLYEFFRNDKLDAANFFTKRTGITPIPGRNDFRLPHRFNQFGGFVSGPVFLPRIYNGRDKTFFTFGYDGIRNSTATFLTTTVPTALQRAGVLTEAPAGVYSPYAVTQSGTTFSRTLLPAGCNGGVCYAAGFGVANINPVAAKLLSFYPLPNAAGVTNNYSYSKALTDSATQLNFRIDHNFSARNRTFLRGTRDVNNHHENDLFNLTGGPGGINQALTAYLFALGHTFVASPNLLFQANYGFAYQKNRQIPQNFTGFNAGDDGFSTTFLGQQQAAGLPFTSISGYSGIANSASFNAFDHYTHTLTAAAILTRGKHTITTGWEGRFVLENNQGLGNPSGNFTFDTTLTNGPNTTSSVPAGQSQFDAFAAFLLGQPTTSSITRQLTLAFSQRYNAFYAQDDWRVTPKLNLNLGLRYDIDPGFQERLNRFADFDPNAVNPNSAATGLAFTGGAQFLGTANNPNRTWKTYFNELAPRFGMSYAAYPGTIVRGGYGIIFLPTSQRIYSAGTLGFSQSTTIQYASNNVPTNTLANPFVSGVALPLGPAAGVQANTGTSVSGEIHDQANSYQQQWNFGIEQSLTSKLTFDLNYAGSHGVHLPINSHPNDLRPQNFGAPGDQTQVAYLNTAVPNPFAPLVTTGSFAAPTIIRNQLLSNFPQYGLNTGMQNSSLTYNYNDIGSASFNGLQAGLQFRGKNLSGATFYTWSKLLGNVSDLINGFLNVTGNPGIQNYYFLKQYERSNLATDIPHRIVGNAIYTLPFGRNQRFGGNISKWADLAVGGWKLNTILSVQSGYPLGITQTGGQSYSGARPTYSNTGVNPLTQGSTHTRLGGVGQSQTYFNNAAFRLSRSFELGNVPRSAALLRSPLTFQDDVSAIKDFEIHESFKLQFRLEAFNLLNKVQFGLPGTTFNSTTFGLITSQGNLPRNVQAALKLYF